MDGNAHSHMGSVCEVLSSAADGGTGYDPDTARKITEKAKPKYREIIAKLPEFEKGDRFSMNIIGCAMLGAFVLCMPSGRIRSH